MLLAQLKENLQNSPIVYLDEFFDQNLTLSVISVIERAAESALEQPDRSSEMTALKPAHLSRKDAIDAVARVKALLPLIEDDGFLWEVLSNAQDVVDASTLQERIGLTCHAQPLSPASDRSLTTQSKGEESSWYAAQKRPLRRH